jgi:pimeloyl-ACP methyl ester carboxylesterase
MALEQGEHRFNSGGESLSYSVAGSGPLLIVQPPGWGVGAGLYRATLQPLEAFATVVYLQPRGAAGTGHSPGEDLNVRSFVQDLEQLRIHLGAEDFHLLGHSHGGLVALHYAQIHPGRLSSLILLNTQLVGLPPPDDEPTTSLAPPPPGVREALGYLQSVGGFGFLFSLKTDEGATEFLRRIFPLYFRDFSNARVLEPVLESLVIPVHTMQTVSRTDGDYPLDAERLKALPMPALVVAAAYDRLCPASSRRRLVDMLPRGRFVLLQESGHFPWLEEPAPFFQAVEAFLADAQRRGAQPGAPGQTAQTS